MAFTQDLFSSRRNYTDGNTRIGQTDRIWYDSNTNTLRIGDGTPGGKIITGGGGGTGFPVTVQDEGVILTANVSVINFTGNGVSAINTAGNVVTVDIISTGEPGPQGQAGLSITSAAVNYSGNLILTLSDTSTVDTGRVKGEPGDTGPRGFTGNTGLKGDTGDPGPQGNAGAKGDKGDSGDPGVSIDSVVVVDGNLVVTFSNTQVVNAGNVVGPPGPQGAQGNIGPPGPQGDPGPAGADGTSVTILGTVNTNTDLPGWEYAYTGTNGDGYITNDGNLWVWSGNVTGWVDVGPIRGPQGTQGNVGPQGEPGANGIPGTDGISVVSATAVTGNLIITLSNLATIDAGNVVGPRGVDGVIGSNGINGTDGISIVDANIATGNLLVTLSNSYTINAGSVSSFQIQTDWNQSNSSNVAYIKNKPDLSVYATVTQFNTLDANVGAYETWANVNFNSQTGQINDLYANAVFQNTWLSNLQTNVSTINANVGSFYSYANLTYSTIANAAVQATWLANLEANAGTQSVSITNIQNQINNGTVATANVSYYPNVTATTTNAVHYPGIYSAASGNLLTYTSANLQFNPGTGNLFLANAFITGSAATATIFNNTSTTINMGGAATTLNFGASGGTATFAGNLRAQGVLQIGSIQETVANAGVSTGNVNVVFTSGSIVYVPSLTGNLTANLQGVNIPSGTITSTTLWLNQGATAYTVTGCYINNVLQTISWQAGTQPLGNANKQDVVILTLVNFGGGYKILGQMVTFG